MIQRQFEFPDGGICQFESHKEDLIEHCQAKSALLSSNSMHVSYGKEKLRDIHIIFGSQDIDFQELAATLKEMIPETIIDAGITRNT